MLHGTIADNVAFGHPAATLEELEAALGTIFGALMVLTIITVESAMACHFQRRKS